MRKNTKTNTLVDVKLWSAIQKHFWAQLEARLAGKEDISGEAADSIVTLMSGFALVCASISGLTMLSSQKY